jgi:hypothetical protein
MAQQHLLDSRRTADKDDERDGIAISMTPLETKGVA